MHPDIGDTGISHIRFIGFIIIVSPFPFFFESSVYFRLQTSPQIGCLVQSEIILPVKSVIFVQGLVPVPSDGFLQGRCLGQPSLTVDHWISP